MAEATGFPYPVLEEHGKLEAIVVVAGEDGQPLMAAAAERLVQIYLYCRKASAPHENLAALRLLQDAMIAELKRQGYHGAEAFLPPTLAQRFGRRLERTFGWTRNWASWNRSF
jgi:hypothetical protein